MISKMSLKLDFNWKKCIKWVVLGLVGVLFLVFFVRVATWEDAYYRDKEGSERDVVQRDVETAREELDETVPTEQEVVEYVVAADRPRYLSIEKLGVVNARVLPMGINDDGALATPNNIFDVGWYEASGKPGEGKTMVIDGHNGGPNVYGVFKYLPDLVAGDTIVVERGDGVKFRYSVVENKEVSIDASDDYMVTALRTPEKGKESITLISCSGDWSWERYTYLSRQFVRAVLLES
ncbi:class F sortase [Candidatus Saccharibacteria bacterium]|nr:class F sortase [Candidatus Saccharibacteria bacterium]